VTIEELVEWVAQRAWLAHINHARLTNKSIPLMVASDFRKQQHIDHNKFTDFAKQILSHKDLYMQVTGDEPILNVDDVNYYSFKYVPLADAIKEME